MKKRTKSVEEKLFTAWKCFEGLRLSAEEVGKLVTLDDAIRTRISNQASLEAGIEEVGADCIGGGRAGETWAQFKNRLRREEV